MQIPDFRLYSVGDFLIPSDSITYMRYFPNEKRLLIHLIDGKHIDVTKIKKLKSFLREVLRHLKATKTRGYKHIESILKQL